MPRLSEGLPRCGVLLWACLAFGSLATSTAYSSPGPIEEEISLEAQKRAQIQEQVLIFAKEKPANVAKLIKTWMVEEESGD